ncbi:MAG: cupin domain-containing protein [Hyphomonadaceae bacterium]|nr:cupin domain-containing protein [Hyphomonadaceae bacterium]
MPKIDIPSAPSGQGSGYPPPHDEPCRERAWKKLGVAAGLTQFGVNLVTLKPGVWSSQRHWHAVEDEFVYVLSGEVTLVEDAGETILRAGDAAAWKGGVRDGHCLKNLSTADATLLVVGGRSDDDWGEYSDIDLAFPKGRYSGSNAKTTKDGKPL